MRQGRLWNSRGGLAVLANDSSGGLTLVQLRVPTAMLCYTCRGGTRDFVFCVWEETLSVLVWVVSQSLQLCAHTSRVLQVQFFCVA